MFRILAVVAVAVALAAALRLRRTLPRVVVAGPVGGRFPRIERLTAVAVWASFAILALSGFCGAALLARPLSGYLVLIHVAGGALFGVGMAALLLLRGDAYGPDAPGKPARFATVQKACFWIIAASTVVLILSIALAMLRIVGTDGQHLATLLHRYSALAALVAAIVYAGAARANR